MPLQKTTVYSGTVTGAGPLPAIAVGTITGDYTIKFFLTALTGSNARIVVEEDSSIGFPAPKTLWAQNFLGGALPQGVMTSFRKREAAGTDLPGEAGTYLRVNVQELNSGLPSATFDCWIES